ncbi:dethiobiotin synthetase [Corynebacterium phocae]|uniref:ATP-dependent dethiobiotin synthetase BioD n=1 Tax=Corynebacterium phocae TaxID=161895 RepID=A0A1L7D230_9CORY|nr:dethiobiotin synthase [Corynebacterium phocae]APT92021.1 dethiobiotin synthetase [Corynebacterium phocae]KAA8726397.1 ATP-dependent dethiobiotin synthetase BioD [Corynebacterium phocae]
MIVCVTGTNTGVGKTIACAALAAQTRERGQSVVVLKPVQTGEPAGQGDVFTVARLAGVPAHEYVRFPEPLAPNLSARRAGLPQPTLEEVAAWVRSFTADVVLVEGAGGLLVRLADSFTLVDLAVELSAPLVVVTSLNLGSLNLAELTVREAQRHGLEVLGLVGGSLPAQPDLATRLSVEEMPAVTGVDLWGCLPDGAGELSPAEFLAATAGVQPRWS